MKAGNNYTLRTPHDQTNQALGRNLAALWVASGFTGTTAGGQPIAATVTITTSSNDVLIQLTNLQDNPTSVIQSLSDFELVLSTGQTSGTLSSSSALARTIAADGTFTDGGIVSTGWVGDVGDIGVHVLGTLIGPAHTLIGGPDGSNVYSNANGSIAGNGPHNPFLTGMATFDLAVLGVTADSLVSSVTFSFGTDLEGPTVTVRDPTSVPEPSTLRPVSVWIAEELRGRLPVPYSAPAITSLLKEPPLAEASATADESRCGGMLGHGQAPLWTLVPH